MRKILFFLVLFPILLFARKGTIEEVPETKIEPWFTGPLVAPTANVVQKGSYNFEPYLFVTKSPAIYDNDWNAQTIPVLWSMELQSPAWIGLTEWCDMTINPTLLWNHKQIGGGAWAQGDFTVQVSFQIWHLNWSSSLWVPSVKMGLRETLPTGKYRNLNPKKLAADLGGSGCWTTTAQLVFGWMFHISGYQFLTCRLGGECAFYNSIVHVKGYNAYRGGRGANGKLRQGVNGSLDLGLEYSVSRNWAFALDLIGYWQAKSKFNGNQGVDPAFGTHTVVAQSAAIQYSVAPGIEYNWNENLGIITGVWFTVAGKQISEFYSFVFAVNWYK